VNRADELEAIIRDEPWLLAQLDRARELARPVWCMGAGAHRDRGWDHRFAGGFDPSRIADIDLVYFDADDLTHESEVALERRLGDGWDVKNQARVHLWFEARFGTAAEPLTSTTDGIATWPEPATCVGVRLEHDGRLTIAAPHGLDDLLDGIWRTNPVRVTPSEAAARLARKDPHARWPGLQIM
jgi:hypothetical protein